MKGTEDLLLVTISNCSLQLWGKGAQGRNKTREEVEREGLCSGGSAAMWPLLKRGSSLSAERGRCSLTCGCAQS